jgi:hypothetical protein
MILTFDDDFALYELTSIRLLLSPILPTKQANIH